MALPPCRSGQAVARGVGASADRRFGDRVALLQQREPVGVVEDLEQFTTLVEAGDIGELELERGPRGGDAIEKAEPNRPEAVTRVPEPPSHKSRSRIRNLSPRNRSQPVNDDPGQHALPVVRLG